MYIWDLYPPVPPQCLLTSRPVRCRALCLWARAWSFSVRTNSACRPPPTAGTKTTRPWRPPQILRTALTLTRARWWVHSKLHALSAPRGPQTVLFDTLSSCVCVEQKFKSVSKTDAGMYRCESSNSAGAPKSCVSQQLKVIECMWCSLFHVYVFGCSHQRLMNFPLSLFSF